MRGLEISGGGSTVVSGATSNSRPSTAKLGWVLGHRGDQIFVKNVSADGSAWQAGIGAGDTLLRVNGVAATSASQVHAICSSDPVVHVVLTRDSNGRKVQLEKVITTSQQLPPVKVLRADGTSPRKGRKIAAPPQPLVPERAPVWLSQLVEVAPDFGFTVHQTQTAVPVVFVASVSGGGTAHRQGIHASDEILESQFCLVPTSVGHPAKELRLVVRRDTEPDEVKILRIEPPVPTKGRGGGGGGNRSVQPPTQQLRGNMIPPIAGTKRKRSPDFVGGGGGRWTPAGRGSATSTPRGAAADSPSLTPQKPRKTDSFSLPQQPQPSGLAPLQGPYSAPLAQIPQGDKSIVYYTASSLQVGWDLQLESGGVVRVVSVQKDGIAYDGGIKVGDIIRSHSDIRQVITEEGDTDNIVDVQILRNSREEEKTLYISRIPNPARLNPPLPHTGDYRLNKPQNTQNEGDLYEDQLRQQQHQQQQQQQQQQGTTTFPSSIQHGINGAAVALPNNHQDGMEVDDNVRFGVAPPASQGKHVGVYHKPHPPAAAHRRPADQKISQRHHTSNRNNTIGGGGGTPRLPKGDAAHMPNLSGIPKDDKSIIFYTASSLQVGWALELQDGHVVRVIHVKKNSAAMDGDIQVGDVIKSHSDIRPVINEEGGTDQIVDVQILRNGLREDKVVMISRQPNPPQLRPPLHGAEGDAYLPPELSERPEPEFIGTTYNIHATSDAMKQVLEAATTTIQELPDSSHFTVPGYDIKDLSVTAGPFKQASLSGVIPGANGPPPHHSKVIFGSPDSMVLGGTPPDPKIISYKANAQPRSPMPTWPEDYPTASFGRFHDFPVSSVGGFRPDPMPDPNRRAAALQPNEVSAPSYTRVKAMIAAPPPPPPELPKPLNTAPAPPLFPMPTPFLTRDAVPQVFIPEKKRYSTVKEEVPKEPSLSKMRGAQFRHAIAEMMYGYAPPSSEVDQPEDEDDTDDTPADQFQPKDIDARKAVFIPPRPPSSDTDSDDGVQQMLNPYPFRHMPPTTAHTTMPLRRDAHGNPIPDELPDTGEDVESKRSGVAFVKDTDTYQKEGEPTVKKELATAIFWKDDEKPDVAHIAGVTIEDPTVVSSAAPPTQQPARVSVDPLAPKLPVGGKIRFSIDPNESCVTEEYQPIFYTPNKALDKIVIDLRDLDGRLITDLGDTNVSITCSCTDGTPLVGYEVDVINGKAVFDELEIVASGGKPITTDCGLRFVAGDGFQPVAGQTLNAHPLMLADPKATMQFAPESSITEEGQPVHGLIGCPLDPIVVQLVDDHNTLLNDLPDGVVVEVVGSDGTPLVNNVSSVVNGKAEFPDLKFGAGLSRPLTDECCLKFSANDYNPLKNQALVTGPITMQKPGLKFRIAFCPDKSESRVTAEHEPIHLVSGAVCLGPIVIDLLNNDNGDIHEDDTTPSLTIVGSCSDGSPLIGSTAPVVNGKAQFNKISLLSGRPQSNDCRLRFVIQDKGDLTFTKEVVVTGPIHVPLGTDTAVPAADLPDSHKNKAGLGEKAGRDGHVDTAPLEDDDDEDDDTTMPTGERRKGGTGKHSKRDGVSRADLPDNEEEGWVDPDPPEAPGGTGGAGTDRRRRRGSAQAGLRKKLGENEVDPDDHDRRDSQDSHDTRSTVDSQRRASDVLDLSNSQIEPHDNDAAGLLNEFANEFKRLARAAKKAGKDWQVIAAYRVVQNNTKGGAGKEGGGGQETTTTSTTIAHGQVGGPDGASLIRHSESRDGLDGVRNLLSVPQNQELPSSTTTEVEGWNTSHATTKVVTSSTDPKLFEDFAQEFNQLSKLVKDQHEHSKHLTAADHEATADDSSSSSNQIQHPGTYRIESQPSPPRSESASPDPQPTAGRHRRRGSRVLRISTDVPLPPPSQTNSAVPESGDQQAAGEDSTTVQVTSSENVAAAMGGFMKDIAAIQQQQQDESQHEDIKKDPETTDAQQTSEEYDPDKTQDEGKETFQQEEEQVAPITQPAAASDDAGGETADGSGAEPPVEQEDDGGDNQEKEDK